MTPLQQHELLFELVNDSVMTRTMEGRINFWNHSAEELYGWRKEEAVGKVSHNLLQTQFPKPLEEIESELVRNGRWEGKLVHTTRDGGCVVVQSRWSLDPKEQLGPVVEVNRRSSNPEAATDTNSADTGRREAVPTSQLMKTDELPAKIANIVLAGGGALCLLVLFYLTYRYTLADDKTVAGAIGALIYFGLPALLATILFACLRIAPSYKIKVAMVAFSIAAATYLMEGTMALVSSLPDWAERHIQRRARQAKELGIDFDARSTLDVVLDLRKQAIEAYPAVSPSDLWQTAAAPKSKISASQQFVPLSGISNMVTVLCNEGLGYVIYESDERGFHNPKGLWNSGQVDIAALGDSFVHGICVPSDKNFVAFVRERYPATLGVGFAGFGPLEMLAVVKEYLQPVKPKIVLWFYYEGNDLNELKKKKNSPLLMSYLADGHQNLSSRQTEIDQFLREYITKEMEKSRLSRTVERLSDEFGSWDKLREKIGGVPKLEHIREALGLVYGKTLVEQESIPANYTREVTNLFRQVLLQAKATVRQWGGEIYFVYLPMFREDWTIVREDKEEIIELARALGLPLIDVHRAFQSQSDPAGLFPLRMNGHYNIEGNRLVADEVLRSIQVMKKN